MKPYTEKDFKLSLMKLQVDAFCEPCETRPNVVDVSEKVVQRILHDQHYITMVCAPPQFGKTAIIKRTIFELVQSREFHIDNIFNITGLSDSHWVEQMKQRMYPSVRQHIYHNANMKKHAEHIVQTIQKGGKTLIVIDEAHYASGVHNTCSKTMWMIANGLSRTTVQEQIEPSDDCATDDVDVEIPWFVRMHRVLYAHGVRILCISATPDAVKENLLSVSYDSIPTNVITVDASMYPNYVGFETYVQKNRVFQTQHFDSDKTSHLKTKQKNKQTRSTNADTKQTDTSHHIPFLQEVIQTVQNTRTPRYHLLRLNANDYKSRNKLSNALEEHHIPHIFRYLDCKSRDFNIRELEQAPIMHTFVFLKDMLRVAKSISVEHVGVLIERPVKISNDSTISQSLIGRCCGWDKAPYVEQITIFTHLKSVMKYIELCKNGYKYDRVKGIRGYGLQTNRHTITTKDCITGVAHERDLHEDVRDREPTLSDVEGLKQKLRTCLIKKLHAYQMIKKLIVNHNKPLPWDELCEGRNLSTTCYTKWAKRGNHYHILEYVNSQNGYRVREDILQEYGDLIQQLASQ